MQLITQNLEATVTASLEKSTRVKAVVVQLTADETLEATGSFPVLIKRCISAAKTRKQRQRQRQWPKTISVIRWTLLMHVHYTFFIIFIIFFGAVSAVKREVWISWALAEGFRESWDGDGPRSRTWGAAERVKEELVSLHKRTGEEASKVKARIGKGQ